MLKRPQTPCYVAHAIHIVPGGHEGVCIWKGQDVAFEGNDRLIAPKVNVMQ